MVTSFTDGTKVQIEQCLVANGLGAGIAREDLIGLATGDLKVAAAELGAAADRLGFPISEYILDRGLQHGVFVIARHDERQALALRNFKLGEGPYYVLIKDYCLVHLEVFKTIERVMRGRRAAAQQRRAAAGQRRQHRQARARAGQLIERGCGSFELRGTCVNIAERPGHVPICLASDLRLDAPGRARPAADHGRHRDARDRGARGLAGDRAARPRAAAGRGVLTDVRSGAFRSDRARPPWTSRPPPSRR